MKQTLIELFGTYAHEIVFLHIISAIIWVGGMIAIRLAVHPNLQLIDDKKVRLERTLAITGKFFNIVIPFILIMIITATIMAVGLGFRVSAVNEAGEIISQSAYYRYQLVHIKEAIWLIMTLNFTFMYIKRYKAQKLFNKSEFLNAKKMVSLIPNTLLPINIVLGIVALWLGVTLRGL